MVIDDNNGITLKFFGIDSVKLEHIRITLQRLEHSKSQTLKHSPSFPLGTSSFISPPTSFLTLVESFIFFMFVEVVFTVVVILSAIAWKSSH